MKQIREWYNEKYFSKNEIYEFKNGVRLIVVEKKNSLDFNSDVLFLAGSFFDSLYGFPQGTSHFLEHIMCGPNTRFKSKKAQDKFKFGNINRPHIYTNASVSPKFMNFYGWGHIKGANRILEYLYYQINYPTERFDEFFDQEKSIILTEYKEKSLPKNKDANLKYNQFIFSKSYAGFVNAPIGDKDSINKITVKDLLNFKEKLLVSKNAVIAIQTPKKLTSKNLDWIKKIANCIPNRPISYSLEDNIFEKNWKLSCYHFKNKDNQNIFLSINFHKKLIQNDIQATVNEVVLSFFSRQLAWYLLNNRLRYELGMVYGVNLIYYYKLWEHIIDGIKLQFDIKNYKNILDEIYNILFKEATKFLKTTEGRKWLLNEISDYIFTRTVNYDSEYALELAKKVLEAREILEIPHIEFEKFAKSVTPKILANYFETKYLSRIPKFWLESPYKQKEIIPVLKESKLYKTFEKHSS